MPVLSLNDEFDWSIVGSPRRRAGDLDATSIHDSTSTSRAPGRAVDGGRVRLDDQIPHPVRLDSPPSLAT
jgi:hypothetical protein